jgi:prolyl-tRNA synthetase
MLEVYREVAEDELAIPVLTGRKTELEKFPGAVTTYSIEGLMRDGRALQCGTSHNLGQNFSRAFDVQFLNPNGEQEYAWGTSWGFSTRMVGATIMAHGDDKGLRLPSRIAPIQVVIIPIYRSDDERVSVLEVAERIRNELSGAGIRVRLDDREQYRPGHKFNEWELKGVPLRIELGPRDVAADSLVLADRVNGGKETVRIGEAMASMSERLEASQRALYEDARAFRTANTHEALDFPALRDGIEAEGGFWVGAWCGDEACERKVADEAKASIRVIPLEAEDPEAPCAVCGKPGTQTATWARAY